MTKKLLALFLVLALAATFTVTAFAATDNPNPDIDPSEPIVGASAFYIIGSFTNWEVDSTYQLTKNSEAEGDEYIFEGLALTTTDQFKVVSYNASVLEGNKVWYPDGTENNYGQNGEIAADGTYTVYFRPNGDGSDGWFYNVIYVELPTEDPSGVDPSGTEDPSEPAGDPSEPIVGAPAFYVIGSFTNWEVDSAYQLTKNTEAEGDEYIFEGLALTTSDQFKVVSYNASVLEGDKVWYPDGTGNNYGQNGEITADGTYTVYFRPNGDGGDDWFYHVIYLTAQSEEPADDAVIASWNFDAEGKTAGEKLSEYGSGDEGYAATSGSGLLTLSVDGANGRALEWSDEEYGESGTEIVPIMAAGKKNLWDAPYIQVKVSSVDCEGLTFTVNMAGSNKAPADWQLSYSTDGETFTPIEGAAFTLSAESRKILTPYLLEAAIPDEAMGAETLYLRLTTTSTATVAGGVFTESPTGGEVALNNLSVKSVKKSVEQSYLLGDADGDGDVTILDATCIQRVLAKLPVAATYNENAAKVAGDDLSILDATYIQRWLAKLDVAFPIGQPV